MVSSTGKTRWSTHTEESPRTHATDDHKRLQQIRQKRPQQAKQRRLQKEREHLQREPARAPRHLQALAEALEELGLPDTIVNEVQWKLRTQTTLLGNICGRMFPPFLGAGPPLS